MRSKLLLLGAAAAIAFVANAARAESYGVHFLGNATGDLVTGSAGVVPIPGWNNINNAPLAAGTTDFAIANSDGSLTTTLGVTLNGAGNNDSWYSGATPDGGNGSLLDGYLDAGTRQNNGGYYPGTATISGLTNASYNVYVYTAGDIYRPNDDQAVTFIEGLPGYEVNGLVYYTATLSKVLSRGRQRIRTSHSFSIQTTIWE